MALNKALTQVPGLHGLGQNIPYHGLQRQIDTV